LAFLLVATAVPQAQALTISFGLDATSIPGLTGFTTSGAMMDGLAVTATFAGGYQETQLWADTGAASGGVSGDNWGLSLTGDTFGAPWTFVNGRDTSLVSLYLNGLNALTVFDITSGGTVGDTPGSAQGWTWVCSSGDCSAADVNVTYNWKVSIGAAAAQGDLWQTVLVEFGANGADGNFSFIQDTDNDSRLTDPVPEPGTLALLGTGLAATRLLRRRR
jgi:hypothetical protein